MRKLLTLTILAVMLGFAANSAWAAKRGHSSWRPIARPVCCAYAPGASSARGQTSPGGKWEVLPVAFYGRWGLPCHCPGPCPPCCLRFRWMSGGLSPPPSACPGWRAVTQWPLVDHMTDHRLPTSQPVVPPRIYFVIAAAASLPFVWEASMTAQGVVAILTGAAMREVLGVFSQSVAFHRMVGHSGSRPRVGPGHLFPNDGVAPAR